MKKCFAKVMKKCFTKIISCVWLNHEKCVWLNSKKSEGIYWFTSTNEKDLLIRLVKCKVKIQYTILCIFNTQNGNRKQCDG